MWSSGITGLSHMKVTWKCMIFSMDISLKVSKSHSLLLIIKKCAIITNLMIKEAGYQVLIEMYYSVNTFLQSL